MPVLRRFAMLAIIFQEALPALSLLSRLTSGFFAVVRPANAFPIVFMPIPAFHKFCAPAALSIKPID
jgi:ABC-type Na+ efflux pump permease subunit